MKSRLISDLRTKNVTHCIAALALLVFAPAALSDGNQSAPFPDTGQLGAQWWQLLTSIPGPQNPSFDETGASCGIGQRGPTWFLYSPFSTRAGPIGDPVELKCTIPVGKTIFVSVLPFICSPFRGETIEDAMQFCKETIDIVDIRRLRINGVARNDLIKRRASSKAFALPTPDDNLFGDPTGIFETVHDGYFATLPTLEPGHHVIRVQAALTEIGVEFDTRYRLHIVKPEKTLPIDP